MMIFQRLQSSFDKLSLCMHQVHHAGPLTRSAAAAAGVVVDGKVSLRCPKPLKTAVHDLAASPEDTLMRHTNDWQEREGGTAPDLKISYFFLCHHVNKGEEGRHFNSIMGLGRSLDWV